MPGPFEESLIILILILANGVFAMSEAAMISLRHARLEQRAEDGDRKAQTALALARHPNQFLATVQVGITLVGIFNGALGGAALSQYLAPYLARVPALAPYSRVLALVLVVLVITYVSLVLGELIPKRIALNNPEGVAMAVARPMRALSRLAGPVVTLLSRSTELGLRIMGIKKSNEPPVTEEEVRIMLEKGTRVGVFEETEQDMVESVFRLGDRRVDAIMTPRTEVFWLDLEDPLEQLVKEVTENPHSIFPVAQGDLDNVIGILRARDFLVARLENQTINVRDLLLQPIFVPESTPVFRVLDEVRKSGLTLAFVIDEYGGVLGVVTLIDILTAIVGEIPEAGEDYQPLAFQRPDGSWLFDGLLRVDELKEILDLDTLPEEDRLGYQTLGGMIMAYTGEIPEVGTSFNWMSYTFEVVDMDAMRVDKVLVTPAQQPAPPISQDAEI